MMRKRIGRICSVSIYIHPATGLFALYMVFIGQTTLLIVTFASILIHEVSHCLVSGLAGYPPEELEITPLGALMRLEDEDRMSLLIRLAMLAAGPAATLLLCWCALLMTKCAVLPVDIGKMVFQCNMLLLSFNLLPAFPLDGGRMLSLLLGLRIRSELVRRIMRLSGTLLGVGMIALNCYVSLRYGGWNLSLSMTGCFLIYSASTATTSRSLAELRAIMDRRIRLETKGRLPCNWVTVLPSYPLRRAVLELSPGKYTLLCIADPYREQAPFVATEDKLIAAYLDHPAEACGVLMAKQACNKRYKPLENIDF